MKNIRFLSRHVEKKNSTEYAVFFEHEGMYARLDWELADTADVDPEHISDLMLIQMEADLADDILVAEIRASNEKSKGSESALSRYLKSGYEEQEVPEFKAKAIARFGDK